MYILPGTKLQLNNNSAFHLKAKVTVKAFDRAEVIITILEDSESVRGISLERAS